MSSTKRKAVINAEKSQLDRVQRLIERGRYRTLSEFVREPSRRSSSASSRITSRRR